MGHDNTDRQISDFSDNEKKKKASILPDCQTDKMWDSQFTLSVCLFLIQGLREI